MNAPTVSSAFELATQIAPHLPDNWQARGSRYSDGPDDRLTAELVRTADGAAVHVSLGFAGDNARACVSPIWPTFEDGNPCAPPERLRPIGCNVNRPPAAMARDVLRRLLAAYLPKYAEAVRTVQERSALDLDARGVARRVASLLGGSIDSARLGRQRAGAPIRVLDASTVVRDLLVFPARSDGAPPRIRLDLHDVDEATATRVLELLASSRHWAHGESREGVTP